MLQLLTRKTPVAGNPGCARPALRLTWELDAQTGKPVGRWIIEGTEPAAVRLASAA